MHIFLFVSDKRSIPEDFLEGHIRQTFPLQSIKEARELISYVKNGFPMKTAIVIDGFDETSLDAQNALLKTFEEPGINLSFILTAKSVSGIAETILSRAVISEDPKRNGDKYEKDVEEFLKFPEKRLLISSEFKDREDAIEFVRALLREAVDTNPPLVAPISECFNSLKGNGNVVLSLTNLVVQLQKVL